MQGARRLNEVRDSDSQRERTPAPAISTLIIARFYRSHYSKLVTWPQLCLSAPLDGQQGQAVGDTMAPLIDVSITSWGMEYSIHGTCLTRICCRSALAAPYAARHNGVTWQLVHHNKHSCVRLSLAAAGNAILSDHMRSRCVSAAGCVRHCSEAAFLRHTCIRAFLTAV